MRTSRIIVADDSPSVLRGIVPILEAEFEVVATASNGRELVEQAVRLSPDLVVTPVLLNGPRAAGGMRPPMNELAVMRNHFSGSAEPRTLEVRNE